jgi:hypothetical protein
MDKKEQLLKLLSEFSEEELSELLPAKKKRRRGKGKRKKRQQPIKESNTNNKFDEIMGSIILTSDERQELDQAKKLDKGAEPNKFRGLRNEAKKIKVQCCKCNKEFEMFQSQVMNAERWSCNNCLVGRGRG